MRRFHTPAEGVVWFCLRSRKFGGYKFRRQEPIAGYIADFYCAELKLIIEMDGNHHESPDMSDYDSARTEALRRSGIRVVRIPNRDLLERGIVEAQIQWAIEQAGGRVADPSPVPSLRSGPPSPR
jgi:very-short-patch-repair endonuclease